MNKVVKGIVSSIIIILFGGFSAFSVEWIKGVDIASIYATLRLPPFSPPSWLFGPVWTVLYIFIGIYLSNLASLRLNRTKLYLLTYIQLVLNISWTIIFFAFSNYLLATFMISIMDIIVIFMLFIDYRKIKWLLVPYLIWLIFASYLSLSVFWLNRLFD